MNLNVGPKSIFLDLSMEAMHKRLAVAWAIITGRPVEFHFNRVINNDALQDRPKIQTRTNQA